MRLLYVSNFYPPHNVGGAEIVAARHAKEMQRRGHHVAVLGGSPPTAERSSGTLLVEEQDGITVYRTAVRSLDPSKSFFWEMGARLLEAVIRFEKPDVVHFHNLVGLGANLIPRAKSLGIPTIVTLHDYWGFCLRQTRLTAAGELCRDAEDCHNCLSHITLDSGVSAPTRLRRDYIAWCLGRADQLVSPSNALAEAYGAAGYSGSSIKVRSNGIDVDRFARGVTRTDGVVRFLFVGYFGEHKGLKVLVEAAKRLRQRSEVGGNWELTIVGDGHLKDWLRDELAKVDCPRIRVLGKVPQSEIAALFAQQDVLVLPSTWPENEPVVLLESIAAGLAQIATAHGGNVDLVHHGQGGMLIAPGDADALASAMTEYVRHPELVAAHSSYNAARRNDLSERVSCDGYEADYQSVLGSEARPRRGDVIVICDPEWPTLETTRAASNLALIEGGEAKLRLVSAEWADPDLWARASMVWLWNGEGNEGLIRQALRRNVPLLIPSGHAASGWLEQTSCTIVYQTLLQALTALVALSDQKAGRLARPVSQTSGDLVALMSKPASYSLYLSRAS